MDIKKLEKIIDAVKKLEFSNIKITWANHTSLTFHKLMYNSSTCDGTHDHALFNTLDGDLRLTNNEILTLAEKGEISFDSCVTTVIKWGDQVDERTHKLIDKKKKYVVGLDIEEFGSDANTKMTDEEMYELVMNSDEYDFPMYEEKEFFYRLNTDEIDTENKGWFLIEVKVRD